MLSNAFRFTFYLSLLIIVTDINNKMDYSIQYKGYKYGSI